jgi:hypothetical protein
MPSIARVLVNSEIKTTLLLFIILMGAAIWSIAGMPAEKGLAHEAIWNLREEIVEHEVVLTTFAHDVAAGRVEREAGRSSFSRAGLENTVFRNRVIRVDCDGHGNVLFTLDGPWSGFEVGFAMRKGGSGLPEMHREVQLLGNWWYYVTP